MNNPRKQNTTTQTTASASEVRKLLGNKDIPTATPNETTVVQDISNYVDTHTISKLLAKIENSTNHIITAIENDSNFPCQACIDIEDISHDILQEIARFFYWMENREY